MTKSKLRELIKSVLRELQEEELEEITVTGDVDGYSTPKAFGKKKKQKKIGVNDHPYQGLMYKDQNHYQRVPLELLTHQLY